MAIDLPKIDKGQLKKYAPFVIGGVLLIVVYVLATRGKAGNSIPAYSQPEPVSVGNGGSGGGYSSSGGDTLTSQIAAQKDLALFQLGLRGTTLNQDLEFTNKTNSAQAALRQTYLTQDQQNQAALYAVDNNQKLYDYNFLFGNISNSSGAAATWNRLSANNPRTRLPVSRVYN